ncbi:MAG: hypothetical protein NZ927_04150 [Candidatus Calescibacterium sp.]|nr:hypothetical protein [Candidatus Calescibacterium sp.]MDW8088018.1 hypothetical protein [Candidatus Calescibacterium sp.]
MENNKKKVRKKDGLNIRDISRKSLPGEFGTPIMLLATSEIVESSSALPMITLDMLYMNPAKIIAVVKFEKKQKE